MYLTIKDLTFKYRGAASDTLKDINIEIKHGEVVAVIGKSGSGKSTLLRLITGLEVPVKGIIKVNDNTLVSDNIFIQPEKRGVGMVFQDYALFPHLTVNDNIAFGLKGNIKEKKIRVEEVLEIVDMEEYGKRYPFELSGGQQQRAALARSLAPKPDLLLLDEPFSNLDQHLREKIRLEINEIVKKEGVTTIFVTHDKSDVLAIADKAILIDNGKIKAVGIPDENMFA